MSDIGGDLQRYLQQARDDLVKHLIGVELGYFGDCVGR